MGLFSSKKVTQVDTAVMRVVQDSELSNTIQESVITGIMEDGNVSAYVVDGLLNGVALKFERMWRYGRDHYHYGLPNTTLKAPKDGMGITQEIIELEQESGVSFEYFEVAPPNNVHVARKRLVEQYGYDQNSNELQILSAQFGYPVYLVDIEAFHSNAVFELSEDDTLDIWDLPGTAGYTPERKAAGVGKYAKQTTIIVDEVDGLNGARIHYAYWPGGTRVNGTLDFSMGEYEFNADYVQAKYRKPNQVIGYWTYRIGTGVHPTLDAVFEGGYNGQGTFFPFVVFRRNKQNRTESGRHGSQEYKTTKKLLNYIGMDFQTLGDGIHENPDINDVEQAVMMMGVPAKSKDPDDLRYLFEFFKGLHVRQVSMDGVTTRNDPQKRSLTWQDADFKMGLSYQGLTARLVPGKIGKVGEYSSTTRTSTKQRSYTKREGARDAVTYTTVTVDVTVPGYVYRKQVSAAVYEELWVENPKIRYDIWDGYGVVAGVGKDELIIPLDKVIADTFSLPDKERLYTRSLWFVFNSRITEKVKWYQTGLFKAILIIVAVIITLYTRMPALKAAIAATATMTISAIAWAVAKVIIKTVIMREVFKIAVKELGEETAFLLAIAAFLYGGGRSLQAGSIEGAPFASEALAASAGLTNAIGISYQNKMQMLQQDYMDFQEYKAEMEEDLATAQELLNTPTLLNPVVFVEGETPDNFYRRTVHSGNIGALVIDAVHQYVDMSLRLPELDSTMQEIRYA